MNKIEEVARAILKARYYDCEPDMYESESAFYEHVWSFQGGEVTHEATDAIKAMQFPSHEMLAAGQRVNLGPKVKLSAGDVALIYSTMLQAALTDGE